MALSFIFVLILGLIHVFANKVSDFHILPRQKWLSFAGGVSVSFVFLHILPELHQWQVSLRKEDKLPFEVENYLYILTLTGLLLFYGLEKGIIAVKKKSKSEKKAIKDGIFWWHIGIFAFYNMLIGYLLLHDQELNGSDAWLVFIAIGFHFLGNDYSLFNHHEKTYHHTGRWIMASAVMAGWTIGIVVRIPDILFSAFFAFIAGGIMLNVLKEEIPEEKESHFGAFLAGTVIFSILLII